MAVIHNASSSQQYLKDYQEQLARQSMHAFRPNSPMNTLANGCLGTGQKYRSINTSWINHDEAPIFKSQGVKLKRSYSCDQRFQVSDAIRYGAEERAEADFTINLGVMHIGWPEFYVGITTVITVYPVTLLVIEIFRRRRDPDLTVGTCTDTFCGLFYFSLLFTFVIPNILQK